MLTTTLLSLALATFTFALSNVKRSSCDISKATMNLPTGQSLLVAPSTTPSFVAVAIGTQNYTCSGSGTYTNVGAVAELFDISCLYNDPAFASVQDWAYALWEVAPPTLPAQTIISLLHSVKTSDVLGQHYYVSNPVSGVGVSPKWDFTSQGAYTGNKNAYVVAAKSSGMGAPTGINDIDWVDLKSVQGSLADEVYRVDTRGGQPPASCTPGSPAIAVKYAAKYWLFGGSVEK